MNDFIPPDGMIYVDVDTGRDDLFGMIAEAAFVESGGSSIEIEVILNPEYDLKLRLVFPDGFVYFRYRIDVYMPDENFERQVDVMSKLLYMFWSYGFPAVAGFSNEELLPEKGGYKNRNVPWPMI